MNTRNLQVWGMCVFMDVVLTVEDSQKETCNKQLVPSVIDILRLRALDVAIDNNWLLSTSQFIYKLF